MTTLQIERRHFGFTEMRAVRDKLLLVGHAAGFNRLSEDMWGMREQIMPGAFKQTIMEDDIRALFNHDPSMVLGRNRSGTLALAEDATGLAMEITLPDTQLGRDLLVSVERGDISGASFGFQTIEDSWEKVDGMDLRTLRRVRLFDLGPVTFPAYPSADVTVARRSLDQWLSEQEPVVTGSRLLTERRQRLAELG